LLGEHPAEDMVSVVLGLIAAATGLLLGWGVPARRLLRSLHGTAANGFRLGGGLDGVVVAPVMRLARWSDALDRGIQAGVLGFGRSMLRAATGSFAVDRTVHRGVEGVGRAAVDVAVATRITDERGIDGLIDRLVNGTRRLGGEARQLQTGLVHRELLLAVTGGALIAIFIVLL
jgi:NADH-quinone oxidoreductase subunit L